GNIAAYGVFGHRHQPEIEQELGAPVVFVPHYVPLDRGILETIFGRLRPGTTAERVADVMEAAYRDVPFVRLTGETLPEIKHVAHTNFCDIGWRVDGSGRLLMVSVIEKRQVDGLRITDEPTLEIVIGVLAGVINTRLVASLAALGVPAVGLTGADAGIGRVEPAKPHMSASGTTVDLGRVGEPVGKDKPALLLDLCRNGYVPVVSSIGAA